MTRRATRKRVPQAPADVLVQYVEERKETQRRQRG